MSQNQPKSKAKQLADEAVDKSSSNKSPSILKRLIPGIENRGINPPELPSKPAVSQPTPSQLDASQPNEPPLASSVSQPVLSQPTVSPLNLLDTLPDSAGYTKTPNRYYDHLCPQLTPDEQAIYSQLFRLSHGYGKETCFISNNRLSERSSVPVSTLKRVILKLVGKGLIEKVSATHGPGTEQGITFKILPISKLTVSQPRMSQPALGHNKEIFKKKDSKGDEPSAFKDCPDCQGTGFWYPEGMEKGVKRCTHERLK